MAEMFESSMKLKLLSMLPRLAHLATLDNPDLRHVAAARLILASERYQNSVFLLNRQGRLDILVLGKSRRFPLFCGDTRKICAFHALYSVHARVSQG